MPSCLHTQPTPHHKSRKSPTRIHPRPTRIIHGARLSTHAGNCPNVVSGCCACGFAPDLAAREQCWRAGNPELLNSKTVLDGKLPESELLSRPVDGDAPALIRAEALWALGDLQGANASLQQAMIPPPQRTAPLRWANCTCRPTVSELHLFAEQSHSS